MQTKTLTVLIGLGALAVGTLFYINQNGGLGFSNQESGGNIGGGSSGGEQQPTYNTVNYYMLPSTQTQLPVNLPTGTESTQIPAGSEVLKILGKGNTPKASQLNLDYSIDRYTKGITVTGANKIVANPTDKYGNKVTQTSPHKQESKQKAQEKAINTAVKFGTSVNKYL